MKVDSIKLKTKSGKVVELSMKEAKDLHNELNNLFGINQAWYPVYIDRPYWSPPYITWTTANTSTSNSYQYDSGLQVTYCNT